MRSAATLRDEYVAALVEPNAVVLFTEAPCDLLLRLAPAGDGRDDIALLACQLSR